MTAEIIKLPLTRRLANHGYLNGFGWTVRPCELERIDRRITNTIAALKKRQQAVNRARLAEAKRYFRERGADGNGGAA